MKKSPIETMEHNKPCLWPKKRGAKTVNVADSGNLASNLTEEEVQSLLTGKAQLEKKLKISDEKNYFALANCDAKNELMKKHANIAQEAFAGWEKAEAVAVSLKQELDVALRDKAVGEERLVHLEAALKVCMQQLRFVREEEEMEMHNAMTETSRDFVFSQKVLENELSDTNAKLGKLGFENAHLRKALLVKEKLIKNLKEQKIWAEAEFNALMVRFSLTEKDNASLKYNVQVLENELDMRNEERKIYRKTSHASNTRNLDSLENIAKSEVEIRRKNLKFDPVGSTVDSTVYNYPDKPGKMINLLTEQLCIVNEENKNLKGNLDKMLDELKVLRVMYARSVSELSQVESRSLTINFARISDSNLMDDFVEMEKLAIADKSIRSSYFSESVCQSDHCHADDCFFRTNKISVMDSSDAVNGLSKSITKIIELIEGTGLPYSNGDTLKALSGEDGDFLSYNNLETNTGYVVRVFQWKSSELGYVLHSFIDSCYNFLNGTINLQKFVRELASALDWIMNHCFSLQDVSSMRDKIKKHYGLDDTRGESEAEMGMADQFLETENICVHNVQLPSFSAWSNPNYFSEIEDVQSNMTEENQRLKAKLNVMKSAKKALESMLQSAIHQSDALMSQSLELEKNIGNLQKELASLKESKGVLENHAENHKMMIEDLATQLQIAGVELNVTRQRLASVEIELESKKYCYEDLEGTCLELQLQLESVVKKEKPSHDMELHEKQLQTDMEIITASEKLAECQETIQSLGKQLKALASPMEASLFDKVIFSPSDTITSRKNMTQQRPSLLDQMLADDGDTELKDYKSLKANEIVCSSNLHKPTDHMDKNRHSGFGSNGIQNHKDEVAVDLSVAIPAKKQGGGGLWRKLLWRRKKDYKKKTDLALYAEYA